MSPDLTLAELMALLAYDPATGAFVWRVRRGNHAVAGSEAGFVHPSGYRYIRVLGRRYSAHRLAWLYVFGFWPKQQIDHVNGVRSDNRISNLREVSQRENAQNLHGPLSSNRTSRFLGVSWKSRERRWRAQIQLDRKKLDLGLFESEEAARDAYLAAKKRLHPYQTLAA